MAKSEKTLIGESPAFLETQELVSRVAQLHKPVLVVGERGTGKEMTAERLHFLSPRWDQAFIKLNCAALPESLLETELFGHEAGAFTGATKRHQGRFERADGGTLFLDEIASMSLRLQEKLLRVIEYGEFERVGGDQVLHVDVRVVGAANMDLPRLVRQGEFRADLLDRLSFDVITLPPLRARREDILLLAEHFAMGMAKELRRGWFSGFSESAKISLLEYAWPGNLRELKNVVERAVYRHKEEDLVSRLEFDPFASPYRPLEAESVEPVKTESRGIEPAAKAVSKVAEAEIPADFKEHIAAVERGILQGALEAQRFNQRKAAAALGLSYDQLRGYLKKYELGK